MVAITHRFRSQKPDSLDDTIIRPSNWNEDHVITMGQNRLLGRTAAGTGPVQEIDIGTFVNQSQNTANTNRLEAEIAKKIDKVGGTFTGTVIFDEAAYFPSIVIRPFYMGVEDELVIRAFQNQGIIAKFARNGEISSKLYGNLSTYIFNIARQRLTELQYRTVSETSFGNVKGDVEAPAGAFLYGLNYGNSDGSGRTVNGGLYRTIQIFDPTRGWVGLSRA